MMQQVDHDIDDRLYRNVMGSFATGVTVITTEVDKVVHGMTANAFMSVSLNPKLVAISIGENARMLQHIKDSKRFAINILSSNQQNKSKQFAGQLKSESEVTFTYFKGLPILEDTLAVITCDLNSEYVVGDHTIFIGHVTGVKLEQKDPLLFSQGKYRELKELEELETTT
ncbi:flavin reductase family protein [Psychrobacillus sp. NPDC058041]|jgi:flavin reductase (DIM6/NTAB) family NADH-FMN oxidoreductase RutF|uniref:flavin reductase family protein n=1 Tax=Psychrobacillus sp. NPDC058041 TaxID=3346310 RepID=UPI0036DC0C44